jgi:hypothetical protein
MKDIIIIAIIMCTSKIPFQKMKTKKIELSILTKSVSDQRLQSNLADSQLGFLQLKFFRNAAWKS